MSRPLPACLFSCALLLCGCATTAPEGDATTRGRVTLKSAVVWREAVWVSMGCADLNFVYGAVLQQIDLATNSIADGIPWIQGGGHAALASGGDALWALDESLAVRFELQQ